MQTYLNFKTYRKMNYGHKNISNALNETVIQAIDTENAFKFFKNKLL